MGNDKLLEWCRSCGIDVIQEDNVCTLEYGGRKSGNPLFPNRIQAHGSNLADAVDGLKLWIKNRAGLALGIKDYQE